VNSSAPATTTSTAEEKANPESTFANRRGRHSCPHDRCCEERPEGDEEAAAPASTNMFSSGKCALRTPTDSALSAISGGARAS